MYPDELEKCRAELAEARSQAATLAAACKLACELLERRPKGLASAIATTDASPLRGKTVEALADAAEALTTLRTALAEAGVG